MAPRRTVTTTGTIKADIAPIQNPLPVEMITTKEEIDNIKTAAPRVRRVKQTSSQKAKTVDDQTTTPVVTENVIEENLEVVPVVDEPETSGTVRKQRVKRVVTKESFYNDLEQLFVQYTDELDVKKRPGQKLSLQKYMRQLQNDASKLLKLRNLKEGQPKTDRSNSGFMKPVNITPELASFIGVSVDDTITRVQITKLICQYIKDHDLQDPSDRRIIEADAALSAILGPNPINENGEEEKLTYYSLQKRIQPHISKN